MTRKNRRVAIVVQRYGEEVNGGAELHARWLAEHLLAIAEVHVVTTCAIEYTTWANEYEPGESWLNRVCIHRFPVDHPRDWSLAQKQSHYILQKEHILFEEYTWLKDQGPYSTTLLEYLRTSYHYFDVFIFFTYLYVQTFFGLPLVSDKAILIPTAHEEPYLYLPFFRTLFHLPRAIAYNTETEQRMVHQVMNNQRVVSDVIGVGINLPEITTGTSIVEKRGLSGDFMVYVGRIDESKNVPQLLEYFIRFKESENKPVKLVLIGKSHIPLPTRPDVIPLGFVSEQEKFEVIAAAKLVVVPSLYESLSMITLESWLMGRPVLVNGRCEVLRQLCRESHGGLYYYSYEEFRASLLWLLESETQSQKIGRQGQQFVQKTYSWDIILAKYQRLFEQLFARPETLS